MSDFTLKTMRHFFGMFPRFDILLAISLGLAILGFVLINMFVG